MWIADVVPEEGISSSQYGNPIRDRVVQTFTDLTEANAHVASLPVGATCHIEGSGYCYRKDGSGQWRPLFTYASEANVAALQGIGFDGLYTCVSTTIPAGFRAVHLVWDETIYAGEVDYHIEMQIVVAGLVTHISRHSRIMDQARYLNGSYYNPPTYFTHSMACYRALDPNVATVVQGLLHNMPQMSPYSGGVTHHNDARYSHMSILATP